MLTYCLESKFREIVRCFLANLSATKIAKLSGISRNSINGYVVGIRQRIHSFYNLESPFTILCDIELDESFTMRQSYLSNIILI